MLAGLVLNCLVLLPSYFGSLGQIRSCHCLMLAGLKEFPLNLDLKGWFKKGLEPPVILKPKFVSCQTQLELLLLNYVSGSVSVVS